MAYISKSKRIQALETQIQATEAGKTKMEIDSLLFGRSIDVSIPGVYNGYTTYDEQVEGMYEKYNGFADFGNQQTRALVDIRSAFIGGDGISVSCEDETTSKWIEDFLERNKLQGSNFVNAIKASETTGFTLLVMEIKQNEDEENEVVVKRFKYDIKRPIEPVYADKNFNEDIVQIRIKEGTNWIPLNYADYIYVRTGGDDSNHYNPTTKIGVVLTDIDNYDRALKDIRRNNYIFARVTPVFEVNSESEAKNLKTWLQAIRWKVGTAFIGKAKFHYESPGTAAYENLISEMTATLKSISATTGVPVHWMGHVDLMSNRSTADSMYETIKNATVSERLIWEEALYDLIVKAQEMYIDAGGALKLNKDFQVRIPLISYEGFKDKVSALSQAFADSAISMEDYRNELPGIDPLKTKKAVEAEQKEQEEQLIKNGVPSIPENNTEGDSENGTDDETES